MEKNQWKTSKLRDVGGEGGVEKAFSLVRGQRKNIISSKGKLCNLILDVLMS